METLNWEQVNTWRLTQHFLLHRATPDKLLDVVSRIGGLHAQMMSAAELELWARIDNLSLDEIRNAIWRDRKLVKTWAMRGTLHLLARDDFPIYVAALSSKLGDFYRRPSWLKYHGVTREELEAIVEAVRATLNDVGMTREQMADAIAERVGNPSLRDLLASGWGALLKPAAVTGYLCFGPSEGQNVTFVQPEKWIGAWEAVETDTALKELARRYLTAYGPGTVDDFSRWFGMDTSKGKRVFKALGDELVEVDVEGWKAWALTSCIAYMHALSAGHSVRLLPNFDPYTVTLYRHSQYILAPQYKDRVYRPQGWISPVVLIDGRMAGVWEYDKKRSQVQVKVDLFEPISPTIRKEIEAEAERLGLFFNLKAAVSFG